MTLAPNKKDIYDFNIEIYLLKEAITKKTPSISKVYLEAVEEIKSLIEGTTDFYKISRRNYDLVSLSVRKYSDKFKDLDSKEEGLNALLEVL